MTETQVKDLLRRKGSHVVAIDRSAAVGDAVALMVASRVGSVVVIDDGGVCGIFSERDCMVRVVLEQRDPRRTPVGEVMTTELRCVTPQDRLEDCMAIMTRVRCRHLPVMAGNSLVGMVSIGDCVAHLCDVATMENGELREYIMGRYPR